jgi:ferredoxin
VKIFFGPDKCQSHARCYGLAPEILDVHDFGLSTVVGDGTVATAPGGKP